MDKGNISISHNIKMDDILDYTECWNAFSINHETTEYFLMPGDCKRIEYMTGKQANYAIGGKINDHFKESLLTSTEKPTILLASDCNRILKINEYTVVLSELDDSDKYYIYRNRFYGIRNDKTVVEGYYYNDYILIIYHYTDGNDDYMKQSSGTFSCVKASDGSIVYHGIIKLVDDGTIDTLHGDKLDCVTWSGDERSYDYEYDNKGLIKQDQWKYTIKSVVRKESKNTRTDEFDYRVPFLITPYSFCIDGNIAVKETHFYSNEFNNSGNNNYSYSKIQEINFLYNMDQDSVCKF